MRRLRGVALLVVLTVLTVACGARFSEQERQLIISGAGGAGTGGGGGVAGTPDAGGPTTGATGGDGSAGTAAGDTGGTGGGGGGATVGSPDGPDPGTGGSGGSGGSGAAADGQSDGSGGEAGSDGSDGGQQGSGDPDGSGGSQDGGSAGTSGDTEAAPPGGNGGATDVGVTGDRIVISNVSDVTGAVPGLFEAAQKAVSAYIAKFDATEGTVHGRSIELVNRDAKMDAQENRRQYLAACEDSLAAVGSMSAFAYGAAQAIRDCGIPDLRTAAVAESLQTTPTVFGADAQSADAFPVTSFQYYKQQHPEAVRTAGAVHVNNQLTQYQTDRVMSATEKIGYDWATRIPVALSETNYAPIVIELKNEGVEFVFFQGAYQQSVRLAEAMQQQNYEPAVYSLQGQNYTPALIASGGQAVEGAWLGVPTVLLSGQHPVLAEYRRWLKQIDPDARPSYLGMYAWSAAKLFVRGLKEIGPQPTRQKLLEFLRGVEGYDAGGLIPPQDVGPKQPSPCMKIVQIRQGRFQQVAPQDGRFRCGRVVGLG